MRDTFAHRLSKFLSRVAVAAAAIAFCVTYYRWPPLGQAGILFLSSVAVVMAIGAGLLSLAIATVLLLRRIPPKPWNAVVVSGFSIAMALVYVWIV